MDLESYIEPEIARVYQQAGITTLWPWQAQCLNQAGAPGRNFNSYCTLVKFEHIYLDTFAWHSLCLAGRAPEPGGGPRQRFPVAAAFWYISVSFKALPVGLAGANGGPRQGISVAAAFFNILVNLMALNVALASAVPQLGGGFRQFHLLLYFRIFVKLMALSVALAGTVVQPSGGPRQGNYPAGARRMKPAAWVQ